MIPGADELLSEFLDKFVTICKEMYEFGIKEKDVRDKEVNEFWKCMNEVKFNNTSEATNLINQFTETKKRVFYYFKCMKLAC